MEIIPSYQIIIFVTYVVTCCVEGARILAMVPFPAKSHQRVIQPLLIELANRGHQVVCYTPHPPENPPKNYTAVKYPDYMPEMKKFMMGGDSGKEEKEAYVKYSSKANPFYMLSFKDIGLHFSEWIMKQREFQDLLASSDDYDAIILETTFWQESLIGLSHRFDAPLIEYMPAGNILWAYWLHGNPFDTNYILEGFFSYTDRMTFVERTFNTFMNGLSRLIWYNYHMPKYQELMDRYLRYPGWEDRPSMIDMITNTSLLLVNTHLSINYPFPASPHFKEVGGLNLVKPNPLPKDLQEFMDSAEYGVVYFTLGSHIPVSAIINGELKDTFLKVFSEIKQKVLWKWETDFPNLPSNIKVSKWFPQQDILAHRNMKIFITHGGMLSTTEAVYQGVPTIGIPVFADQHKNVKHMEHFKYGLTLHIENITYDSLKWAVNEILNNPEYSANAKQRSLLLRDKPETALETAVYWTEYVLRHKGAHHLKPAISTMPWYQQAMIDVYAAILLILLIPIYIMYKIVKCFVYCISCRSNKQNIVSKSKKNK